jgi:hypothetical protein
MSRQKTWPHELYEQFYKLWTLSVGAPGYEKRAWQSLESNIDSIMPSVLFESCAHDHVKQVDGAPRCLECGGICLGEGSRGGFIWAPSDGQRDKCIWIDDEGKRYKPDGNEWVPL